ncbi:CTLH/CRA C-terminal to lish motif domain-containing protein [Parachaetomium inaequale]|uniref:CTLH/CRA C-terminal to lish motif domain-containing protein n=1 Tax=Parachaetomium inaequale TaxID=2588326 RepID=A0AAN6PH78_9PEZI|nr:CTLH/CRA C-terminal to lish motif domain-containing protein [Parachaetomium inaequale]
MSSWSAALELGGFDFDKFLESSDDRMNSSTSTATPPQHAFEKRAADVKAPKSDINALILDYLTMEGYPKAAAKFCKEANLQPQQPDPSIQTRQDIQHAIHSGNIETAISALNDLDPELLDTNPKLHFSLLRLQLVELIRQCNDGDVSPALDFATKNLAPRASANRDFLDDLEQTMALIIFPHDKLQPQLAKLLSSDLRRNTATNVNEAMLLRQNQRREAAIRQLVRMRAWAETSARSKKKDLPESIELGLNADSVEYGESGHEPMITT